MSLAVKVWNGIVSLDEITEAVDARGLEEFPETVWCCEPKQVLRLREFIRLASEPLPLRMLWC